MRKDLKYILAFLLPIVIWAGLYFKGRWSLGGVYLAFVVIPLIESFIPAVNSKIKEDASENRFADIIFDILLYANIPLIWFLFIYGMNVILTQPLTNFEYFGLMMNLGVGVATMGINVSHELGHRTKSIEVFLARAGLLLSQNMYFTIEHNVGHHKYVATYDDPGTARRGESLYQFWLRAVPGVLRNAWKIEKRKTTRNNESLLSNKVLQFLLIQLSFLIVIFFVFGLKAVIAAVVIALTAQLLLETINYIEHYGLERKLLETGRFESFNESHAWNSEHFLGRIFLFELTRHSDHHMHAKKTYQRLENFSQAPQMKYGYPVSMIMATMPPIWKSYMNSEIEKLRATA